MGATDDVIAYGSSMHVNVATVLRWLGLLALIAPLTVQASAERVAAARIHFERGDYAPVLSILEPLANESRDADVLLLLGKAYGRLAESAPWYRALTLARRCGSYLERAVAADATHREALSALVQFHQRAPGIVGGDRQRAERLGRQLERLLPSVLARGGESDLGPALLGQ